MAINGRRDTRRVLSRREWERVGDQPFKGEATPPTLHLHSELEKERLEGGGDYSPESTVAIEIARYIKPKGARLHKLVD